MCKHVHPYLLQCKGIYMDYCLSFVAIILVWYSHLFCVIIWYVFNHYVNGKEFLKNWIYIDFTLPPSHHPHTPHSLKHTHTHTHTPFTPLLGIANDFDLLIISQCYCMTVAFHMDTLEVMYVWMGLFVYTYDVYIKFKANQYML